MYKKTILFSTALLLWAAATASAVKYTQLKAPPEHTITLEQAYDMTLTSDQTIRTAYYEIRKASLLPWSALAKYGPQVSAGANYTNSQTRTSNDLVSGGSAVQTSYDQRYSGFIYTQPIFDPSFAPAYRYGKLSAKATRLQYQFTVRETLYGVAQAYYNVLKQQKLVVVSQETVDLASQQLATAQARYDAGAVARIDVLRAQSTLEGDRNTLIQYQGTLDIARDTLSNILNLGGKTDFTLVEPTDETDLGTPFSELLKRAYENREDYKVSAIGIDQKIALKGEVAAEYGPTISAQGSTNWTSTSGDTSGRVHGNTGVLSVSIPFLTGGQREIDMKTATYNVSQAQLSYETAAKTVESDVKTAWINVETGREALKALNAEVKAAAQNYTDLEAQYQAGAATSLDAQSALRDLNNARTLLTNQIYDYQISLRNLQRAQAIFQPERVEKSKVK
jgi:outer membrane protein TolC